MGRQLHRSKLDRHGYELPALRRPGQPSPGRHAGCARRARHRRCSHIRRAPGSTARPSATSTSPRPSMPPPRSAARTLHQPATTPVRPLHATGAFPRFSTEISTATAPHGRRVSQNATGASNEGAVAGAASARNRLQGRRAALPRSVALDRTRGIDDHDRSARGLPSAFPIRRATAGRRPVSGRRRPPRRRRRRVTRQRRSAAEEARQRVDPATAAAFPAPPRARGAERGQPPGDRRHSHGTSPSTPAPVRMDTHTRRSQAAPGTGRRPGRQPHRTRADGCEPARSVGNTNPKVLCGTPPRPRQGSLRPWRSRAIRVSSSRGCGRRTPRSTAPDVVSETSPPQCGLGSLLVVVGTWPRTETDVNDECGFGEALQPWAGLPKADRLLALAMFRRWSRRPARGSFDESHRASWPRTCSGAHPRNQRSARSVR